MNMRIKKLLCAIVIAALVLPFTVMANSLRIKDFTPDTVEESDVSGKGIEDSREKEKKVPPPVDTYHDATPESAQDSPEKNGGKQTNADTGNNKPPVTAASGPESASGTSGSDFGGETIKSLGELRSDLDGKKLILPSPLKDTRFLEGSWGFDRILLDERGNKLRADFNFNDQGHGTATLIDEKGISYTASILARRDEDGELKFRTTSFTSKDSPRTYDSMLLTCTEKDGAAVFSGNSGFSSWEGQHMVSRPEPTPEHPVSGSNQRPPKAPVDTSGFTPERPSGVVEGIPSAKAADGLDALSALNGSWRYSRDLLRKEDGQSLGLEFHFDNNGKGHSVLKDGTSKVFRADAQASVMSDGSIRVKTGRYGDGSGQEYYPTFMECRGTAPSDLLCDVSNGWSRSEGGKLFAKDALEKMETNIGIEEYLPVAPTPQEGSSKNVEDVLAGLADELNKQNKQSLPSAGEERKLSLGDPESASMSFLEGHWRCNTGLARTVDNQPVVVEFQFDKNGKGSAMVREQSGKKFKATASADYRNGTLRINTSDFYGNKPSDGKYHRSIIQCTNVRGYAMCNGRNGGISWHGASFIRIK